jgi:hypothetical protein
MLRQPTAPDLTERINAGCWLLVSLQQTRTRWDRDRETESGNDHGEDRQHQGKVNQQTPTADRCDSAVLRYLVAARSCAPYTAFVAAA